MTKSLHARPYGGLKSRILTTVSNYRTQRSLMSDASINSRLTIPNVVTSLRLLLLPPFVAAVVLQASADPPTWARGAAFGLFLFMSITDMFDGMLARKLSQISRLGAILDAVADKMLLTVSLVLLYTLGVVADTALPSRELMLPGWVLAIALAKDMSVCVGWMILRRRNRTAQIGPSWAGKCCTAAQMILVLTMLLWYMRPALFGPIARAMFLIASVLAVATMFSYGRVAIRKLHDTQDATNSTLTKK